MIKWQVEEHHMQRYFILANLNTDSTLQADPVMHKHMKQVMRYRNGDQVICIDDQHQVALATIADIEKGVLIKEKIIDEDNELDVDVTLVYGLPKSDKFEFVLQKATELGVSRVVPFLCNRSVIKMDEVRFAKKQERFMRIVQEASEQSHREKMPLITPLAKMKDLPQYLSDINLVAYEESSKQGEHRAFYQAIHGHKGPITIIVGPEGGFDEKEVEDMKAMGIVACSLGKRILRSETAPLYMLSVIGYERELVE